jgi:hypothetical protein
MNSAIVFSTRSIYGWSIFDDRSRLSVNLFKQVGAKPSSSIHATQVLHGGGERRVAPIIYIMMSPSLQGVAFQNEYVCWLYENQSDLFNS